MSRSKAEEILREFCEDVKLAHGIGRGAKIDEEGLSWPDLATTYKKALKYLSKHPKSKDQLMTEAAMKSPGSLGEATENGFKRSFR